jgi:superfamily II DNA or RNA helicase
LAGLPVLVLATRTRLVRQIHERLRAFGVYHGVIAASLPELSVYDAMVQVASVDTLHRRAIASGRMPLPSAAVVIFDEAHLSAAETRVRILDSYPHAVRIGFTATPARKSGRGLGNAFDCIISGPSIRELIAAGQLAPLRIFNTPVVTQKELADLPRDADNDYASGALGEILSRPKLIGDVVENWLRIAPRKRTLVFAVNKAHAAALLESFSRQGIAAEMLTDQDDEATREEVIQRLEQGSTHVLVNCFLLSYGTDLPAVECVVLARPTRSLVQYLQMVGRGMRPAPGKSECLLIDHGHVVETLGLPHADRAWTLDSRRNINTETLKAHKRHAILEKPRTCPQCSTLWLASEQGNACPSCGWAHAAKAKGIAVQEAHLQEMADEADVLGAQHPEVENFFCQAMSWDMRRSPDKWAGINPKTGKSRANSRRYVTWLRTCKRFRLNEQHMPRHFWRASPAPCAESTAGWLLSDQIRFARSKQRAA